jgi:hypothetical protein
MSDPAIFGLNLFGDPVRPSSRGPVADAFVEPPFTVLDARSGDWQDRKRAWAAMGIQGEVGRSAKAYNIHDWADANAGGPKADGDGTSIFDPVICELAYRWFCPEGGQVLDPFAGGSVRGIVAGALGRKYWGCDLRTEQIAANEAQADSIGVDPRPVWVCGNSKDTLADAPPADLVFTCPPYGDLERYSDDESDLSAMSWTGFSIAYRLILTRAVAKLRDNRFACLVVGNFRDPRTGLYRDLVGETVAAMTTAGLGYYNEAVLVTSVGSASMRVTKQFNAGRKLCKTHQNVLVFIKGDWRRAVAALG